MIGGNKPEEKKGILFYFILFFNLKFTLINLAEPAQLKKPAAPREQKKIDNADDFVPAGISTVFKLLIINNN